MKIFLYLVVLFSASSIHVQQRDDAKHFMEVFSKYEELGHAFNRACTAVAKDSNTSTWSVYAWARKHLEDYGEHVFDTTLDHYPDYFCKTSDTTTLALLFKALLANTGSADELPPYKLATCFVCKPEVVVSQLRHLRHNDRKELGDEIYSGIMNGGDEGSVSAKQLKHLVTVLKRAMK